MVKIPLHNLFEELGISEIENEADLDKLIAQLEEEEEEDKDKK
jgi:hypothetical protein